MLPGSPAVDPDRSYDGVIPGVDDRVDATPLRILLVDDSDRNLGALEAVLGDLDAEIVKASSGTEALRALLRDDFALILLDVRMPGMDGFETAELIRARDRTRSTPIIFVTAFDRARDEEIRGYALGAVDFLSKPLVPEVLRGKVAVMIELQRKTAEIRRQAALLDEARRRAHARALDAARQRWEQESLRARVEQERRAARMLERANARLTLLSESASDLLLLAEPEAEALVAPRLFERVAKHLDLEVGLWHQVDPAGRLSLVSATGLDGSHLDEARPLAEPGGPIALAASRRERTIFGGPGGAALGAGVAVPLVAGDRIHGVVTFATRVERVLAEDELATLELLGRGIVATLERWCLLAELRDRARELKDADSRKDQFLAMLGHELRNPLAPVLNAVKLMIEGVPDDDVFRRVVGAADRQIRHMTRLLDDLLDVSRIRNGKIELKRSPMDLREAIQDALQATESAIADRGHALTVSLPDTVLPVEGDPVRLAQVFTNLLHNAAKYTDRGGHIELRAERRDDTIVVIVRDDGIGIPPEMLPRIFEVFVQVDQGPDRARGGLGLGLTLVRTLVEMHGGGVLARSDGVGQGSEFELALPALLDCAVLAADTAATGSNGAIAGRGEGHPATPGAGPRPRPLRIVVVDDNADIRDSLKALLEFHGHAVEGADDGQSGIDMIRARNPEVAVVDIGLPGMDGYQVARALRGSCASTRLVAMTGYGRPEDRQLALEAGFDAHLVKPVDFDDLTRVLQQITER